MYSVPIALPRKLSNQLLQLAQRSPDIEICGLVSSYNGVPIRCYPITNSAEQARQQFLLNTEEHIAAMTAMRERGEVLFAIYHSHPTAPALPSLKDLTLVAYAEVLYLIISLNTKGLLEMRGFKIEAHHASEVALSIEP